jgi:hypothetical protein
METAILDERDTGRITTTAVLGSVGAIAFAVASVWYGLAVEGITVPKEPVFLGHESLMERYRIFYGWVVQTLPQERLYVSIAIAGFVCLGAVGVLVARAIGRQDSRVAGSILALGASLWVAGNVAQLGGHRAVGLMSTHGNPLPTVNAISFTLEMIDDAFETVAFAAIGVAMLVLAWAGTQVRGRAWGRFTAALGLLSLVLAGAYVSDQGDLVNLLLLALGAALLPGWLLWTSTRRGSGEAR